MNYVVFSPYVERKIVQRTCMLSLPILVKTLVFAAQETYTVAVIKS